MTVALRRYAPHDLDALVSLDCLCFAAQFRFSRTDMRRFAEAVDATTLLAEVHQELAGFVIVAARSRSKSSYVVTLDVAESFVRQGIGTILLQAAEIIAVEAGKSRMTLHVHTANHAALAFYKRNGYQQTAVVNRFYGEGPEGGNAFLYAKKLMQQAVAADA